ncbi:MAG: helix-turn-helix domain-containing protein [Firmicutes bacterium]|nr:helix-turn-helix domain-containing protein [Bacillota bacterium]
MSQLGGLLRQRREEQGLSLEDLQARTKIRKKYLAAIEAGDFDVIPGEVYLRGFIRNVASELGIDPEEAMRAYYNDIAEPQTDIAEPEAEKTKTEISQVRKEYPPRRASKKRSFSWLGISLVLLIIGIVAVYMWSQFGKQPDPNSGLPAPVEDPVVEEPVEEEPADEPVVQVERQNPDSPHPVYWVQPGPLEVVLKAEGDSCWVGVRADNKSQEMTLDPRNSQRASLTIQAQNSIKVRVGRPSALRLMINGLDQGIIGGNNAIDLTIELMPDS